jgi:hypothetical protein
MRLNRCGFEIGLGIVCVALYGIFSFWYGGPGSGTLTKDEVEVYLSKIQQDFNIPEREKAEFLERLRTWGMEDDGKPVYMLNLMRTREKPYLFPGVPMKDFHGTAEEANRIFEEQVIPLLLKRGEILPAVGTVQGKNLIGGGPGLDDWSRVGFARYANRRAFFELLVDPRYKKIIHLKFVGMQLVLVPVAPELAIPDLRLVVGGALLVLFLGFGWLHSGVRFRRAHP